MRWNSRWELSELPRGNEEKLGKLVPVSQSAIDPRRFAKTLKLAHVRERSFNISLG
jgi:hypothetical protein